MMRRRFREVKDVREIKGSERNEIKRIEQNPMEREQYREATRILFEALFADDYGMTYDEYVNLKLQEGRN
ncbi:hypothetical protein [Bacteroides acidifaciens]|uniref:hypothetical protein n=1 Tax=Bacteroides acidifaciens TaxID=85831 RepID=UPI00263BD64F|nr:hypothetical protein [Bacteroides acidifaciens]